MGWMHTCKPAGQSMADFFVAQGVLRWSSLPEGVTYRVLDTGTVHRRTFYAAVERTDTRTGKRDVFAVIALLRWTTGNYNLLYKDMDETMGPYEATCPERILALLTPTDNEYANEWRDRCRAYHARRRAAKNRKPGELVKLDGATYLLLVDGGRAGWEVRDTQTGRIYRMKPSQLKREAIVEEAA